MRERVRVHPKRGTLSPTKQAFKEQCDFNLVIKNYQQTGTINHIRRGEPMYGNFDQRMDLMDATLRVNEAQAIFDGLESGIREVAGNDKLKFAELLETPEGRMKLYDAGLEIQLFDESGIWEDDGVDLTPDVPGEDVSQEES